MSISRQLVSYGSPTYHYHRLTYNVGMLVINSLNNMRYINHLYYTDDTLTEVDPHGHWADVLSDEEFFKTIMILIKNRDRLINELRLTDTNSKICPIQCIEILIKYLNKRSENERRDI